MQIMLSKNNMKKPYVIYHITTSADGMIAGSFLEKPEAAPLIDYYYECHRKFNADAFLCGRVTMQGSFTGEILPDCSEWAEENFSREDFVAEKSDFYAVAVDTKGKLNWKSNRIADDDPGYDNAHIIEILCENVRDEYIGFLRSKGISYVFAGKEKLDLAVALDKLKRHFNIEKLLLEGGGIIGGAFAKEDLIDEMSFVSVPVIQGKGGQPVFADIMPEDLPHFSEIKCEKIKNGLWIRYFK